MLLAVDWFSEAVNERKNAEVKRELGVSLRATLPGLARKSSRVMKRVCSGQVHDGGVIGSPKGMRACLEVMLYLRQGHSATVVPGKGHSALQKRSPSLAAMRAKVSSQGRFPKSR